MTRVARQDGAAPNRGCLPARALATKVSRLLGRATELGVIRTVVITPAGVHADLADCVRAGGHAALGERMGVASEWELRVPDSVTQL